MSRRRRRRTSQRFSQPSSPIASQAAPTEQPDEAVIRYAETDDDVIAIHRFLLVVARPAMLCEVNVTKSLIEVIRVTKEEVALMAIKDGRLIGTMGLIRPVWWYGDDAFLTDRWHFVLPQEHHGDADRLLKAEARKIAALTGLPFIDQGKIRPHKDGTFLMMPRVTDSKSATSIH